MKHKFFYILALLIFAKLNSVVILVHGTFASNSGWYKPVGSFFKTLEKSANLIGHKVVSFRWSGANNDNARFEAAESFAKLILSYPSNEKIIVIGHSHAGNIIALATKLLYDPIAKLQNLIKDKKTIETKLASIFPFKINQLKNSFGGIDNLGQSLTKKWIQCCKNIHEELVKYKTLNFSRTNLDNYLIDKAYFLATPVDEIFYVPKMSIIKKLYHFYSSSDLIQPVFGFYKRLYVGISRIINFKVTLFNNSPSHENMHNDVIAEWILLIPEKLIQNQCSGFENFDEKLDGEIHFDKNSIKYVPNINTIQKFEQSEFVPNLNLPAGNSICLEL